MKERQLIHSWAILLALCVATLATGAAHGEAFIVREGEPRAEIVISEEPSRIVPIAAEELQSLVERMTGARLPIVTERAGGTVAVFVGRSDYTDALGIEVDDLDHDAYRMVSGDDWLALLGRDDDYVLRGPYAPRRYDVPKALDEFEELAGLKVSRLPTSRVAWRKYHREMNLYEPDGIGTANAVYAFLRDLGFRWYFPGEVGQVVPTLASIPLPSVNRTVRADFALRRLEQYYHGFGQPQATEGEVKWHLSLGLNWGYEERGLAAMGHGLSSITTGYYAYAEGPERDAFLASQPEEFYALYDGKRDLGGNQCLSSEKLFETAVKFARAMFDIYDVRVLDLSPDDGFSRLCECEKCEGKDTPERGRTGALSNYVWGFINRVAEEVYETHPDRFIGGLAYSSYLLPPQNIERLNPNVAVMICKWRTWHGEGGQYTTEEVRQLREAWLEMLPSKRLYRWDYFLHARDAWSGVPVYFPRLIAEDMRWLKGVSRGEASEVFRNYEGWGRDWHALATNHLNVYVNARYFWDAAQDIDALLDEYYDKFYGPAAEEMKAFVEYGEGNWRRMRNDVEAIDRAFDLLGEAQAAVAAESVYGERIQLVADYMDRLHALREQLSRERVDVPDYRALRTGLDGRLRMRDKPFDGKLDDTRFWPLARIGRLSDAESGANAEHGTRFQALREGNDIYFGIRCLDADIEGLNIATTQDGDERIFDGDHVTILIETLTHSYYEITINPAGALFDADHGDGERNTAWRSEADVAVHIGEDYWSAEIRIPIAGAEARTMDPLSGVAGDRPTDMYPWYFNVGRQRVRGEDIERTAYSPTGQPHFHVVERFARMWGR